MSIYYPIPQPTIATNILLRRDRRLPVPGEVLVRAGARVEPGDVVAQSMLTSEPVVVNIAADLDLSPQATARRLLVSPGAQVERGGTLAQRAGRGSRVSRSPVAGTFSGYDPATGTGQIVAPSEPVSVTAHLKGIVTDVIPYYGATIETPANLVRGIFGLGGERHGVMKVLVTSADESIAPDRLDARVAYSIVLGGSEITADALRKLIELGARGVITGSIRASELSDFLGYAGLDSWRMGVVRAESKGWDFPPPTPSSERAVPPDFVLIITEGFGTAPMCRRVFETIAAYDGQEIAVDGSTRLRGGLSRPEIIIPLARTTAVRRPGEISPRLAMGSQVRLLAQGYLGQTAQIVELPTGPRSSQSGVVAQVADVQMADGQKMRVPLVDLEAIE
ncbi:MAG TPA: hypothetical protein VLQ48_02085 [Chloroflexia bacterium]|nr:hypothetical protein [Chloroflexia bacterium]